MQRGVREWVRKAEADYRVALREVAVSIDASPEAVCFHAQQCSEKYLKAVLMHHGLPIPRVHDLVSLWSLVSPLSVLLKRRIFDPTGNCVLAAVGEFAWWTGEGEERLDPSHPSPGGRFRAGRVLVFDLERRAMRQILVSIPVVAGWLPDDSEDMRNEFISEPQFLDADTFRVYVPNGEWRAYALDGTERGNPDPTFRRSAVEFYTWAPR